VINVDEQKMAGLVFDATLEAITRRWAESLAEARLLRCAIERHRQATLEAVEERESSDADTDLWAILDL
jgi:hypothetical protein